MLLLGAQRESALAAYATWYPPVQQTLLCLSKLYRCVEPRVFAGLAQDAVSSCALAVQVRGTRHPRASQVMNRAGANRPLDKTRTMPSERQYSAHCIPHCCDFL